MTPPHAIEVSPADEFNKKLIENAHPPDWTNPKPAGRYNLVVVGAEPQGWWQRPARHTGRAGSAHRTRSYRRRLSQLWMRAIEGADSFGAGAYAVTEAREFGIETSPPTIEFADVMRRVRRVRAEIAPNDSVQRLRGWAWMFFWGMDISSASDPLKWKGSGSTSGKRSSLWADEQRCRRFPAGRSGLSHE